MYLVLTTVLAIVAFAVGGCRMPETRMVKKPPRENNLWVVEQRKLWGDYGSVLVSGYARRETDDAPLALHRTGPFLPPLSFPRITNTGGHAVIVSDDLKRELVSLNLPGVTFRDAAKSRIIPVAWEKWDLNAADPAVRPAEGEPENYVWNEKHDAACADKMSRAFELVVPVGPIGVDRVEDPDWGFVDEFVATSDAAEVPSISRSHPKYGYVIVDDSMRMWLEKQVGPWVRFSPVRRVRGSLEQPK
jgi:hypothetical protein